MSFRITRVYTRSGDAGQTGLVGGARVSKTDLRVAAFGDVDEVNALIGVVKEHLTAHCLELRPVLDTLQQELFDLGAELATPPEDRVEGMWQVTAEQVRVLETLCDKFGEGLPELTSFILPGGSVLAAFLHQARTVQRRAERSALKLQEALIDAKQPGLNPELLKYLNRLSDLLFVFSRWVLAREGKETPLWVPALKRTPNG